jgi:transposase-like protein
MKEFDPEQIIKAISEGKNLTGEGGALTPLIKMVVEGALKQELNEHLQDTEKPNRKNGSSSKKMKSSSGEFQLDVPRDRAGDFEPQLVKKNQTSLTPEIDHKILSLFSLGMSYRDIKKHVSEMYGIDVATGTINSITNQLIDELDEWKNRPLEAVYPVVWLDAIHYKIKKDGVYENKAVYTLLGLNVSGEKEILGLEISESEGAKYWLSVLTKLQNRGVKDILIACVDGLSGFPEAIATVFPDTEVQLCVIHQIRNSMRYVASKNHKEFMRDLKPVYQAISKEQAESALDALEEKWGEKYPIVIRSWRNKWNNLSAYFKYPEPIRKIIYTTNAVEAVHRQFRKLTKTKGAFPDENSLLKLLYAGILNATKKWTRPIQNWNLSLSQLAIYFDGRLDNILEI